MTKPRSSDGFTLVELMVVVLIVGILVSIAIPVFTSSSNRARATSCLANQTMVSRAAELYRAKEAMSPPTLQSMVDRGYFLKLPACPSKGTYVWLSRTSGGDDSLACSIHYINPDTALWSTTWADMNGIKTIMGKWTVAGGVISGDPTKTQNRALFGDAAWTDVSIKTKATLNSGSGYGIYFRATDGPSGPTGYSFQYDPGGGNKFVVRTIVNGAEIGTLAQSSMPAGFAIYGTSHDIQITTIGTRIVATVDGKVVLDFKDSTFSSGQAGLRTWNKSSAGFGAVSVYKSTP
jgi:prepilin-type N-terminal cleavage/methylation domain-containing protein